MTETKITLHIANMKCGGCVVSVEQAINGTAGVETAEVSLEDSTAVISGSVNVDLLIQNITDAGYPAKSAS